MDSCIFCSSGKSTEKKFLYASFTLCVHPYRFVVALYTLCEMAQTRSCWFRWLEQYIFFKQAQQYPYHPRKHCHLPNHATIPHSEHLNMYNCIPTASTSNGFIWSIWIVSRSPGVRLCDTFTRALLRVIRSILKYATASKHMFFQKNKKEKNGNKG